MCIYPDCSDTFSREINVASADGVGQDNSIIITSDCAGICLTQSNCIGFDWGHTGVHCWLHFDVAKFTSNGFSNNADQYTRVQCQGIMKIYIFIIRLFILFCIKSRCWRKWILLFYLNKIMLNCELRVVWKPLKQC